MIKFLRKLRSSLLAKNQTNRYLFYAFGEIILVMLGILLALQVNNWNENRKTRKEVTTSLSKIEVDLRSDSLIIQSALESYQLNLERGMELWSQLYKGASLPDCETFVLETQWIGRIFTFAINGKQYRGLESSDNLRLLNDSELREKIILYYTDEAADLQFDLLLERTIAFHDLAVDAIPLEAHIAILEKDQNKFRNWAQNNPQEHYRILEKLKDNPDVELFLKNTLRSYLLCISTLEDKAVFNAELRSALQLLD